VGIARVGALEAGAVAPPAVGGGSKQFSPAVAAGDEGGGW
jgi:hypothetical protein